MVKFKDFWSKKKSSILLIVFYEGNEFFILYNLAAFVKCSAVSVVTVQCKILTENSLAKTVLKALLEIPG
jgi:hypothetical protein